MSLERTEYLKSIIQKSSVPDTNALYAKLVAMLDATIKDQGDVATVAEINALEDPITKMIVEISDSGTITLGSLAVVADDYVYFDGLAWIKPDWLNN